MSAAAHAGFRSLATGGERLAIRFKPGCVAGEGLPALNGYIDILRHQFMAWHERQVISAR